MLLSQATMVRVARALKNEGENKVLDNAKCIDLAPHHVKSFIVRHLQLF
jgi:hypothetical protein